MITCGSGCGRGRSRASWRGRSLQSLLRHISKHGRMDGLTSFAEDGPTVRKETKASCDHSSGTSEESRRADVRDLLCHRSLRQCRREARSLPLPSEDEARCRRWQRLRKDLRGGPAHLAGEDALCDHDGGLK